MNFIEKGTKVEQQKGEAVLQRIEKTDNNEDSVGDLPDGSWDGKGRSVKKLTMLHSTAERSAASARAAVAAAAAAVAAATADSTSTEAVKSDSRSCSACCTTCSKGHSNCLPKGQTTVFKTTKAKELCSDGMFFARTI